MSYVSPLHILQTQDGPKAVFYGVLLTFLYKGNTNIWQTKDMIQNLK